MSKEYPKPRGLGREGGRLWEAITGSVAENWVLDGRDLFLLEQACELREYEEAMRADIERNGVMLTGPRGGVKANPAVSQQRILMMAVLKILAKIELRPPREKTGHLNRRQRMQLADARRARWPRAES